MAYIVLTTEDKDRFVEAFVTVHQEQLEKDLAEKLKEYSDDELTLIEALCDIIYEAYDADNNTVIEPLCYEADDIGWECTDLLGDDDWSIEDVDQYIRKYLPEFELKGKEHVSFRGDVADRLNRKLGIVDDCDESDEEDGPYDCYFCPLEDTPLEERPCGCDCEHWLEWMAENSEESRWPIDSFSEHFDSEEDEKAFWDSSV